MPIRTRRWTNRGPTRRSAHDDGFDPDRYDVTELDKPTARLLLSCRRYAPSLLDTSHRYGLISEAIDTAVRGERS